MPRELDPDVSVWEPKKLAKALGGRWIQKPKGPFVVHKVINGITQDLDRHLLFTRTPLSWAKSAPDEAPSLHVAAARGATAAVIQREQLRTVRAPKELPLLLVKSTRAALRDLAVASRDRFKGKAIALTGTVGKTTSREMLRHVLDPQGGAIANLGNNNNLTGVQKVMGHTPEDWGFAVMEMGFGRPLGGIAKNSAQVRPHVALLTNVSEAHLDMFTAEQLARTPGVDLIAQEKSRMFEGIPSGGSAVMGCDHAAFHVVEAKARECASRVVRFGRGAHADARLTDVQMSAGESRVIATWEGKTLEFSLRAPGEHMALNALGVLCTAVEAGADLDATMEHLGTFEAVEGRSRVIEVPVKGGTAKIVDDAFNAAPASVLSSLKLLEVLRGDAPGRKVAVLGDVGHMGPHEKQQHAAMGTLVAEAGIDVLITNGELMEHLYKAAPEGVQATHTRSLPELYATLREQLEAGDVVALKSGRGRFGLGDLGFRAIVDHLVAGADTFVYQGRDPGYT